MGSQQLLLIVLGLIIVGVAIFLGVFYFQEYSIDSKRNAIINESINLAAMAQQHYQTSLMRGEVRRSFSGWVIPFDLKITGLGRFDAIVFSDSVRIICVGNEVLTGTQDSLRIETSVTPSNYRVNIIY